jgi:hypothetical protein
MMTNLDLLWELAKDRHVAAVASREQRFQFGRQPGSQHGRRDQVDPRADRAYRAWASAFFLLVAAMILLFVPRALAGSAFEQGRSGMGDVIQTVELTRASGSSIDRDEPAALHLQNGRS